MSLQPKPNMQNRINGMPNITENRRLYFRDAYHPILYLNNKQKMKLRIHKPLNCNRKQNHRNFRTQCGVKQYPWRRLACYWCYNQECWFQFTNVQKRSFDRIMTDIGDNQSLKIISTYSYRLKTWTTSKVQSQNDVSNWWVWHRFWSRAGEH
jgi:DNA mismatch repair protein MutS2